jgi:carbon-monoxide dehydrogenase small subunit
VELGAVQCGYCTPAMVLMSLALLEEKPKPTVEDIKNGLAGTLCRCTGYTKVIQAVLSVAEGGN